MVRLNLKPKLNLNPGSPFPPPGGMSGGKYLSQGSGPLRRPVGSYWRAPPEGIEPAPPKDRTPETHCPDHSGKLELHSQSGSVAIPFPPAPQLYFFFTERTGLHSPLTTRYLWSAFGIQQEVDYCIFFVIL